MRFDWASPAFRLQTKRPADMIDATVWRRPMPYIRLDEDGIEADEDDNIKYTGDFKYMDAAEVAYKPQPFNPAKLAPLVAKVLTAMRAIGAVRFRVRYDGGHDEGFSHAESVEMADGSTLPIDALVQKLANPQQAAQLRAAAAMPGGSHWYQADQYYAKLTDAQVVSSALDELADLMTSSLLGQGYGTGEYSMYGAITADLKTGAITDDPDAPRPPDVIFD
jgi:hypothetical protein